MYSLMNYAYIGCSYTKPTVTFKLELIIEHILIKSPIFMNNP